MQRQCEAMEVENIKIAEKLKDLLIQSQNNSMIQQTSSIKQKKFESECFRTPKVGKQQNKKILEEDGIKCFDLERHSLLIEDGEDFDLRESIGFASSKSLVSKKSVKQVPNNQQQSQMNDISDQIQIMHEIDRLKRDNDDLLLQIERLTHEKESLSH